MTGFLYPSNSTPLPEETQDVLEALVFQVNEDMELTATWHRDEENPFTYSLNENYELLLGV